MHRLTGQRSRDMFQKTLLEKPGICGLLILEKLLTVRKGSRKKMKESC